MFYLFFSTPNLILIWNKLNFPVLSLLLLEPVAPVFVLTHKVFHVIFPLSSFEKGDREAGWGSDNHTRSIQRFILDPVFFNIFVYDLEQDSKEQ